MEKINSYISIIIPLYNREVLIVETLNSVIAQTYKNWEVIVVDDGSTDKSISVVEELIRNDSRIKIFKRDRGPKGATTCRNIGLEKSTGNFIIFLDSDDLLSAHCLNRRMEEFERNTDCDFICFPMMIFKKSVGDSNILTNIDNRIHPVIRYLKEDYLWAITQPIWKRESLIRLGGFDTRLSSGQEVDLHIRALLDGYKFRSFLSNEPDSFCRHHIDPVRIGTSKKSKRYFISKKIIFDKIYKTDLRKTHTSALYGKFLILLFSYFDLGYRNIRKFNKRYRFPFYYNFITHIIWFAYLLNSNKLPGFYRLRTFITSFFYKNNMMKHSYKGVLS